MMYFTTRAQARNFARSTGRRVTDRGLNPATGSRWGVRLSRA